MTGPSSNDQALNRLYAATALIGRDVVFPLSQVATHIEIITGLVDAAITNVAIADGMVQQAIGMTDVNATTAVLNTQLEELMDYATAAQASMDGAADLCGQAVDKIQVRIARLQAFGR